MIEILGRCLLSPRAARVLMATVLLLLLGSGQLSGLAASGQEVSSPASQIRCITTPEGKAIVEKILAAYGGVDNLKKVHNTGAKCKGKFTVISTLSGAANSSECEVITKGDKVLLESEILGEKTVFGFDGKIGWTKVGDWVAPSSASTVKEIREELQQGTNMLISIAEGDTKVEPLGTRKVGDKDCEVLKVTVKDGSPALIFADCLSHLLLRSEYKGKDSEQGTVVTKAIEYLDYRPVLQTPTAFKSLHYTGDKKTGETAMDTYEFIDVDDKVFDMPQEQEIPRLKQGSIVLPFEYVSNEILVSVRINRNLEEKFLFDTGASRTIIDKSVAEKIGPYKTSNWSVTAASKAVPVNYTILDSITLGDYTIDKVSALVLDLSMSKAALGMTPAGLIGANVLRRFLVTIDFEGKKIYLFDPRQVSVPANAYSIPTSPVYGATALVTSGKIDDKSEVNFLVDTGAAFNNLPQSLAKKLYSGPVLAVGQVLGVDGQKMTIGAIRFKSLKLGNLTIENPVFSLPPDQLQKGNPSGLFNASAMGILGNPIWSQFKMTVDYRGERLILEPIPSRVKSAALLARLDRADNQLLRTKNTDDALKAYATIVSETAALPDQKGIRALAMAKQAIAFVEKGKKTGDRQLLDRSAALFQEAVKLAHESGDKASESTVQALWAAGILEAPRGPADVMKVQALIMQSIALSPTEPTAYAVMGSLLCRSDKGQAMAAKLLDQALMLDPANWRALWAEYQMFKSQGKVKEQAAVSAQLKRYYADVPEVMALASPAATLSKPHSAPPVKKRPSTQASHTGSALKAPRR